MAKKPQTGRELKQLLGRYRVLQDSDCARELLEACEGEVRTWRYAPRAMFPEVPFVEELYGGRWFDKPKRNAFPHGFDSQGQLALIQWYASVAYTMHKGYVEAAFITHFGDRRDIQAVRHIWRDAEGRIARVMNLALDCGYDNRYVYEQETLLRLDSRYWAHQNLRVNRNKTLRRADEEERTLTFRYSKHGRIQDASPADFF
jgi:hypothetical protein